jgi:hypothetical protein
MPIFIYALQQEKGIKIGISTNWEKRKRSYQSQGNVMNIIKVVTTTDTNLDSNLKHILKNLGLCVKIKNQSSTEVYNINCNGVLRLFDYISSGCSLNQNIVDILLKGTIWRNIKINIRDFRNLYGTKYKIFEHQRPARELHIKDICNYICSKFNTYLYTMTPIIVVNNGDDTYDILDGNHRTHAYLRIPENHLVLREQMSICEYQIPITTAVEKLTIFRAINQNLPMSKIHLNENFIIDVIDEINKQLIKSFGKTHIRDTERKADSYDFISVDDINQFTSRKNLLYLLEMNKVAGLDSKTYATILCDLNHNIYEMLKCELDIDIFDTDQSVLMQTISDDYWDDALILYTTMNNNNKLTLRSLKNKLDKIHIQYRKKINYAKSTKIKKIRLRQTPFLLGLLYYKSSLMECNDRINERVESMQ